MEVVHKKKRAEDTSVKNSGIDFSKLRPGASTRLRDINGRHLPYGLKLIIECIITYRGVAAKQAELHLPITKALKNIKVSPRVWNELTYWWRSQCKENESEAEVKMPTFDGVTLEKGSQFMPTDIVWEFYPLVKAEA